jgi:curved DNA-binding protein CbpA
MNPLDVLGLPPNYTLEQLREKYKTIAMKVHPDRPGGSDYLFKLVTSAYKELVKKHAAQMSDKQFYELKQHSKRDTLPQKEDGGGSSTSSFNINRFNRVFEENKLPDAAADTGYKEWMMMDTNATQPMTATKSAKKLSNKFNIDRFNEAFEQLPAPKSKSLTKYKEPAPIVSSGSRLTCTELGIETVNDYSGDTQKSGLVFTDYKKAHTTSRLITPDMLKKGESKQLSLDHVEKERSSVRFTMTDKEKDAYEAKLKYYEQKEKQRLEAIRKKDRLIEQQYMRLNNLLAAQHHGP